MWFRQIRRFFDKRCAVIDEVLELAGAEKLTTSIEHLNVLAIALQSATFENFHHIRDGKSVLLETRLTTIDDFLLQLNIVNNAIEKKGPLNDWSRIKPAIEVVSLYDFLVSNEGFVVYLQAAIKRSVPSIFSYIQLMSEGYYQSQQMEEYQVIHTELMRYHLKEVMLAIVTVSDQSKSNPRFQV